MRPPLNHMMLNDDTLADEFDAIIGYRTIHAGFLGYTEEQVRTLAGIPSGITPGYTGSPGTTATARTARSGAANSVWTIATSADAAALANGGGTGTETDPYVIQNFDIYAFTAANSDTSAAVTWNDNGTSGAYWIKFVNVAFGVGTGNGNRSGDVRVNAPTGGGAIFQNCTFESSLSADSGRTLHIEAVQGTVRLLECKIIRSTGAWVTKSGANAIIEGTDLLIDRTAGAWSGGAGFFTNTAAGGSLTLSRVSHDTQSNNPIMQCQRNWAVLLDRIDWNTSDNGGVQSFVPHTTGASLEAWTAGFELRNSRVRGATPGVTMIGGNLPSGHQAISNANIHHCNFTVSDTAVTSTTVAVTAAAGATTIQLTSATGFAAGDAIRITCDGAVQYYSSVGSVSAPNITLASGHDLPAQATAGNAVIEMRLGNARMIGLGQESGTNGACDNNTIAWCRFRKPYGGTTAGNEVVEFWRASNTVIEYCWVDQCGEDAYEFVTPYAGCEVRFCGGGDISGSYVGGNMVDFYGSGSTWTSSSACEVGDIWGSCGGDAVIVDSVHNVAVDNIDVTNVSGTTPGFEQNPPASNVRLHWRATATQPGLNGVTVGTNLTSPANSFNGKPVELTYESAGAETYADGAPGTVAWNEWNGSGWDARGGADGVVDAM